MMDPIKRKEGVLHAIVREVSNLYNANLFSTIYSNYKVIADNNNCQQFNGKFKFSYIDQNNQYCGLPNRDHGQLFCSPSPTILSTWYLYLAMFV